MEILDLVTTAWNTIEELEKKPVVERHDLLTNEVQKVGEMIDDQPAKLLPPVLKEIYMFCVDNVIVDNLERQFLWSPLADTLYSLLRLGRDLVKSGALLLEQLIADVVKRVESWFHLPMPA